MPSLFSLHWRQGFQPPAHPVPLGIERRYVDTSSGKLELLAAASTHENTKCPSQQLFFLHGGLGCATVWLPWMSYFQKRGFTCYAVSLRGHGQSWQPGYWRMTWDTSMDELADDVRCAWDEVIRLEGMRWETERMIPVLISHSSGGGLAQYMLDKGLIRTSALVLCASVPGYGSMGVYWNWFKNDPWFLLRSYAHLMHPRSPLSSTPLVHRAFFSPGYPEKDVREFGRWMPPWESMWWPLHMMPSFVSFPRIVQNITGWNRGCHVCVVAGTQDKLMGVVLMEKLAGCFRTAAKKNVASKKIESPEDVEEGVEFVIVKGAGHHLQNDLVWEDGARQLLAILEALY